jgi:hypothetical protein
MRHDMWRAMVWAILAGGLVIAPVSASAPPKASSGKGSTAAAGNTSTVVTGLHQAKTLLDTAIHDYDGHRGKAVEELHHAIRELTPHTHKANGGNAAGAAKANGGGGAKQTTTPGETQAQSDAQLKQALELLSGLSGQIPNTHPKAEAHIQTAIAELNVALKIK